MDISERLRKLRSDLGLSQKEFAEKIDTKQAYVQRYESGTRIPDTFLCSLIDKLNIDIYWFLTGEEKPKDELTVFSCDSSECADMMIPVLSNVAAGESYAEEIPKADQQYIPALPGVQIKGSYGLVVKGDSMEPVISENDILIVRELKADEDIFIGLDYVVVTESGPMVKTVYYEHNEEDECSLRLSSYNRAHRDIIPQNVYRIFKITRHIKKYKVPEEFDSKRRVAAKTLQECGCFVKRRES